MLIIDSLLKNLRVKYFCEMSQPGSSRLMPSTDVATRNSFCMSVREITFQRNIGITRRAFKVSTRTFYFSKALLLQNVRLGQLG